MQKAWPDFCFKGKCRSIFYLRFCSISCKIEQINWIWNGGDRMKELILDDGSRLLYQLSVKRVKNMNLRVRPDGSVSVSVSRRISQRQAEEFIRSHIDWIRRAQSRSLKRTPVTLPAGLVSGDLLRWQGKEYAARVKRRRWKPLLCSMRSLWSELRKTARKRRRRLTSNGTGERLGFCSRRHWRGSAPGLLQKASGSRRLRQD